MKLLFERMHPDIDPDSLQLMDSMRHVAHALRQVGENSLVDADMSYARYRLLLGLFFSAEIEGRQGLNPSEISERQGTSRNTISSLIRDLEEEGLIERQLDSNDRRKFIIRLTPSGQDVIQEHNKRHLQMVAQCFEGLTAAERKELRRILDKLAGNLDSVRESN